MTDVRDLTHGIITPLNPLGHHLVLFAQTQGSPRKLPGTSQASYRVSPSVHLQLQVRYALICFWTGGMMDAASSHLNSDRVLLFQCDLFAALESQPLRQRCTSIELQNRPILLPQQGCAPTVRIPLLQKFGIGTTAIDAGLKKSPSTSRIEDERQKSAAAQLGSRRHDDEATSLNIVKTVTEKTHTFHANLKPPV